jgi:hypothetical protein
MYRFVSWGRKLMTGVMFCLAGAACLAADRVVISVETRSPGAPISENALGVSYETSLMLPGKEGKRYFRPDNGPLVTMFKTLGIKSLRIGGNSVDAAEIPVPTLADIEPLFEFAKAAGVKIIYSVRLQDGDPQSAATLAKAIGDRYAQQLDCFAIGNEPSYYKDYNVFRPKWKAIHDAIRAVCPDAKFCGPDQNPSPALFRDMVRDFGGESDRFIQITAHHYPFGCAYTNPGQRSDISKLIPFEAEPSREKMLAPKTYDGYESVRQGLAGAVAGTKVSFRLTEVNSYWFSGLKGASDSYASALWGVDYLHWWTSHGAAGLNFHTGDRTGGALSMPCRYAAFVTSGAGYEARPLAYGMKLFDLGGHGPSVKTTVAPSAGGGLVAYAVLGDDTNAYVTIINKAHGADAKASDVELKFDAAPAELSQASAIFLEGARGDLAGGSGDVTLGGAAIREDGTWHGQWTHVPIADDGGGATIVVRLPPASAVVVKEKLK